MKIEEVESRLQNTFSNQLQDVLKPLVPPGYRAYFYFYDGHGKKKRKDASAENWSAESGQIQIRFHRDERGMPVAPTPSLAVEAENALSLPTEPMSDVIRALSLAEHRPGFEFVSLKWFRDSALTAGGYEWAKSDQKRQEILRDAITKRLILTSKVPNPKDPQFPVTAIRLNRLMPEVKKVLGQPDDADSDFHPVEIGGEPVSDMIIRERRRQ